MSGKLSPARLKTLGNVALVLLAVITVAIVLMVVLAPKPAPAVSDKVQSYYDEASKETAGATPTPSPSAAPVIVSVDLTSVVATESGEWKEGLSGDGVHASPAGSKLMADAAAQQIPALIR